MKKLTHLVTFFVTTAMLSACFTAGASSPNSAQKKIKGKIRSEAGLNIPSWGVAIDAVYDNRLDKLLPGYKILNVVLTNRSPSTIYLNPRIDRWTVKTASGKYYPAINHLSFTNPKLWTQLPSALQQKLDYPSGVRAGKSVKIDLFFPDYTSLDNFREIAWRSSHFKKVFSIYTEIKDKPDPKEFDPNKGSESERQAYIKYNGDTNKYQIINGARPPLNPQIEPRPAPMAAQSVPVRTVQPAPQPSRSIEQPQPKVVIKKQPQKKPVALKQPATQPKPKPTYQPAPANQPQPSYSSHLAPDKPVAIQNQRTEETLIRTTAPQPQKKKTAIVEPKKKSKNKTPQTFNSNLDDFSIPID